MYNIERNDCYVYVILVDEIERYIGKGSRDRIKVHIRLANKINKLRLLGVKVKATKFHNRLARAIRNNSVINEVILINNLTHEEAFKTEVKEIASRPKDQLWNGDFGGLGPGRMSDDVLKVMCEKQRISFSDPETKARRLAAMEAGKKANPNYNNQISETKKKYFEDNPEEAIRLAKLSKARWEDPIERQKLLDARAKANTPEVCAKRSSNKKADWADPIKRKHMLEARVATQRTEEHREKCRLKRKAKKQEELDQYIATHDIEEIEY